MTPSSASAARSGSRRRSRRAAIVRLYADRVTQAEQGCDFDFLSGKQS